MPKKSQSSPKLKSLSDLKFVRQQIEEIPSENKRGVSAQEKRLTDSAKYENQNQLNRIKTNPEEIKQPFINNNKKENTEDAQLFQNAMKGVTRLKKSDQALIKSPKPLPKQRQTTHNEPNIGSADWGVNLPEVSDHWEHTLKSEPGEKMTFKRPGVSQQTLRKLANGDWTVQAQIDLHGYRVDEARIAIHEFIGSCVRSQLKCVQIIHGKGLTRQLNSGLLLKEKVQHWLPQFKPVLAYCHAPENHGGSGAVFVLLKTNKR